MFSLSDLLVGFLDSLTGHLALAVYLLAVTDERAVWRRLKKLPLLFLSPLAAILLSFGLYMIPAMRMFQYYISSFGILVMCTLWVRWAWKWGFWQSFAAVCMAGIFQVADATLSMMLPIPFAAAAGLHLGISIAISLLLYRLRFGAWFCLLLDNNPAPWRMALLLFALEATMEMLLRLAFGVQPRFLTFYYLLVVAMVVLMAVMIVYLAQRIDTARKIQAQRDVIAQQQLYEQDLEMIRREVRTFRHDYKNLLAGLSQQAGEGELEGLRRTLSELDAGFDLRLGQKIQASTQIGNLRIPEVRSLLLSKLTAMREKGVECRLEAHYPVAAVDMDVWDFVRCLGILIDNAVEAALDTERPWVEIVLLAQDRRVFLRVSNPYANHIEPGCMWNDGWSTKGAGRGLGLSSYQRILEGYPNASPCTSWENGVFVQGLTVEGRR
ncbi:MAG: GHKL domain-containing protein [Oscillospiraceae bacterium]|jgi:two-component system sensor histidine kinase AgrC|nr:GHKL domain-containing protein [Oscillospiraceae bacterium]